MGGGEKDLPEHSNNIIQLRERLHCWQKKAELLESE